MALDLSKEIVARWQDQDPNLAPLLREGGIDRVLVSDPNHKFRDACKAAGVEVTPVAELNVTDLAGFVKAAPGPVVIKDGLWPGISGGPKSSIDADASASARPWVDANGFLFRHMAAVSPGKTPVLAYEPNEAAGLKKDRVVPFDTLELALIEAWVNGGNYVLAVEERYRTALLKRDERALTAWRQLGRTARWLKEQKPLLGRPLFPQIALLVDVSDTSTELSKLMSRHNACPALFPVADPPAPAPDQRVLLVAACLGAPPAAEIARRILAHATAGTMVVVDRGEGTPWWQVPELKKLRDEPDRETYQLGRGKLVAYKGNIDDPNDFALDTIDLATHPHRAVRLWNTFSSVATATPGPAEGPLRAKAVFHIINYGSAHPWDVLAYVQGHYNRAQLVRPEADPVQLKTAFRGPSTELNLPSLKRLGVVALS